MLHVAKMQRSPAAQSLLSVHLVLRRCPSSFPRMALQAAARKRSSAAPTTRLPALVAIIGPLPATGAPLALSAPPTMAPRYVSTRRAPSETDVSAPMSVSYPPPPLESSRPISEHD